MTLRLLALTLLLTGLSGCATPSRMDKSVPYDFQARTAELDANLEALRGAESALMGVLAQLPVDCPRACELRSSIEDLAIHICVLVDQITPSEERAARCTDAQQRAEAARASVARACKCSE